MSVRRVRAHRIRLPFRRRYAHALADRTEAEGIILEVELASGRRGFGEALPRPYVTGETIEGVLEYIGDAWARRWTDAPVAGYAELTPWLEEALDDATSHGALAAYGACELAVFDAIGKETGASVAAWFGTRQRGSMRYTGPISAGTPAAAGRLAKWMRWGRLHDVKIKVGFDNDIDVVAAVRAAAGPHMDLRVDANGAWDADTAIAHLDRLREFRISAVEQPVPKDDVAGMARVQAAHDVPVVADESACTPADVERLAAGGACRMINVRVGKCGGLLGARRVVETARRLNLAWHLGCLVGETAILSAAGRHFAFGVNGWRWAEGSYGPFLLKRDIAKPQPRWGWAGSARPLRGPGLGVEIQPVALAAVTVDTRELF